MKEGKSIFWTFMHRPIKIKHNQGRDTLMPLKNNGARIYNLFPRLVGKMPDWEKHFPRISELGFDWIYINPFHYPGFSGSLYAPKDYFEFNPLFVDPSSKTAPMKQLENTIQSAHKNKLKVIMDLVINHTAKDHPFTKKHPDWYKRDENGDVKSPGAWSGSEYVEWGDLAEIDNENSPDKEKLWKYWEDLVLFYCEKGIDGFRADAAYQVPAELWKRLISQAKKNHPEVTFFAESLGCSPEQTLELAHAGFDYLFNSSKYWDFREDWLLRQNESTRKLAPSISFPESHDTQRLAYELHNNLPAIKQRILFTGFFSAGWMITMGMEYGFKNKTDVVHTLPEHWEDVNYNLSDLIRAINTTRAAYPIFNEDNQVSIVDNSNWGNVICLLKVSNDGKERCLMILNKDGANPQDVRFDNLAQVMGLDNKVKITDISIENRMTDIPFMGFHYTLQPCEMKLFYSGK